MLTGAIVVGYRPGLADGVVAQQTDVLDMSAGALVLAHTGQWNKDWPAMGLIDGTTSYGWASPGRKAHPHSFVIELAQAYAISSLAVDNSGNDEPDYPGISARDVVFYGSLTSPDSGYTEIAALEASKGGRIQLQLDTAVPTRWLKLEVRSNYGHGMHTEIMELEAYGQPVDTAPQQADASGIYVTNYGRLLLSAQGNRLEGCYEMDTGYLHGTVDGRFMQFDWREHKGTEFGTANLVLSSGGDYLSGLWYEDGELQGPWFGSREAGGEKIQCDPLSAAADVKVQRVK